MISCFFLFVQWVLKTFVMIRLKHRKMFRVTFIYIKVIINTPLEVGVEVTRITSAILQAIH